MTSGTRHILLIDDDKDDAELFSDAVEELEVNVGLIHFIDGNEAVKKLYEKAAPIPDIIFLDINMPHINGWECLKQLKIIAHLKSIPIVMYSTSTLDKHGIAPADVGASAFLTKPSNFEELKNRLMALFTSLIPG